MGRGKKFAVTCGVFLCVALLSVIAVAQNSGVPRIVPPPVPAAPSADETKEKPTETPPKAAPAPSAGEGSSVPTIVPPTPEAGASPPPGTFKGEKAKPGGPPISDIVIEGTQRIDPNTVLSYMTVKVGTS